MIALLIVTGYLVGAIFGYRSGYVSGYERSREAYRVLGKRQWHSDGLFFGAISGLFWPVMLPLFFVGAHLTPTPPSVRVEENERLIREQSAEIARLEREAGIR